MTFMPDKKSERIKIYVLIIGIVVFAVTGYFRFFHKKQSGTFSAKEPVTRIDRIRLPEVKAVKSNQIKPADSLPEKKRPMFIRDIFTALKPSFSKNSSSDQPSENKLSDLKIKGTIVDAKNSMAIINDQFVKVGDWIGKYRVVHIDEKGVLLDSGDHQITLEIIKDD